MTEIPAEISTDFYTIEKSENGKYLVIILKDVEISLDVAKSFFSNFVALGLKTGIYNGLIDVRRAKDAASILEKYDFAYKDVQSFGFTSEWKVALLIHESDDTTGFVETVMQNAGYNFHIFNSEEKAIKWLSYQ